jgi:hypothetical protein
MLLISCWITLCFSSSDSSASSSESHWTPTTAHIYGWSCTDVLVSCHVSTAHKEHNAWALMFAWVQLNALVKDYSTGRSFALQRIISPHRQCGVLICVRWIRLLSFFAGAWLLLVLSFFYFQVPRIQWYLLMVEELCTTPPCRTFGIHACQSKRSHSMRTGFVKPNLQVPMLPLTFCNFTCMYVFSLT